MTAARGIRNKNPGNIEASSWTQSMPGYVGSDGRFAVFDTFINGIAAQYRLLMSYRKNRGLTTLRGIVNTWAPPKENDVSSYLKHVGELTGYGYDDELPDNPDTYRNIAWAMACHECGADQVGMYIGDFQFLQAMSLVFPDYASQTPVPGIGIPSSSPPGTSDAPPGSAPPPKKEPTMPLPTLLIPILATVVEAIPTLMRAFKGDSKVVERNARAVDLITNTIKTVTGESSVLAAAEKVLSDPVIAQQADKAFQSIYFDLVEVGGGIEAARKTDAEFRKSGDSVLRSPSFIVACMLIPLVYIGMVSVSMKLPIFPDWPPEIRVAIISSVIGMVLGGVVGYYFGMMTSRNRAAVVKEGQ